MLEFLRRNGEKLLKFIVNSTTRMTLLATLMSVAVCLVLFFVYLFSGDIPRSLVSLAGMLSFIYANKQF